VSPRRARSEGCIRRTVSLMVARDCHLCQLAREKLAALSTELDFEVREVDITGVLELECAYREWIPVIELDGERISVYRVEEEPLRHKLAAP
jgi:glutaredoxin